MDWIPGMEGIRLKDLPTFLRTTNPDEYMLGFILQETERAKKASAIVLNTSEELEREVIDSLSTVLSVPIYAIGPLQVLQSQIDDESLKALGSNLWKEEPECLEWLDKKKPNSVVYVNFGSITVMTRDQMVEFAWGLANSKQEFLWIIRPDLVTGESAFLPAEFVEETKNRGFLAGWCPQEQVLNHPSIGGFLTHNGWNSTLESISAGVPMISWPFFAEQQTNCWFCWAKWGIGMEINSDVKRHEVENLVIELMVGEKGKEMKKKAAEWKKVVRAAAQPPDGSACSNLERVIKVLLSSSPNRTLSITN